MLQHLYLSVHFFCHNGGFNASLLPVSYPPYPISRLPLFVPTVCVCLYMCKCATPPHTGSCIVLSGNDDLCHAEEVKKMCEVPGHIKVIVNPNLFHGAFLLSRAHTANLMREVQHLLATSGSLVVHMARPVLAQTISAARSLMHEVETLKSRWVGVHQEHWWAVQQGMGKHSTPRLTAFKGYTSCFASRGMG